MDKFRPGEIWLDTNGIPINAHGGGMLHVGETTYWYGEHKIEGTAGNRAWSGVHCYASEDLLNWRDEGIVLPVEYNEMGHDLTAGCVLERPKVLLCPSTGKYVMWFHLELRGEGYGSARVGVAVADEPTGPFDYQRSFRPNGAMSRDMTLFVDQQGQAYHLCASEENQTLHISPLADDYLDTTGFLKRVFIGRSMEAPAMFSHEGRYWFMGSDCTGWAPNPARSAVADEALGDWTELGNPCLGEGAETTFDSQSTYIMPIPGKEGAFIYMGDRWNPEDAIDGRYIWLPIMFEDGRFTMRWHDAWDLSVFD